jgi:hypothetical protein
MGAYLVRYTTEDGTFFHNANTLAENLREQASGIVSPALVIHDEGQALRLAKLYQGMDVDRVEILTLAAVPVWSSYATLPMRKHPDMG